MRLSQGPGLLIKKMAQLVFFFAAMTLLVAVGHSPAYAEELSRHAELAAQKLIVTLEPRDPSCLKPSPIKVNKLFCILVAVQGGNEAWQKGLKVSKFDALMPDHHHGMVTRPKITAKKSGEYLIEGVKLHMTGDWSLELKLEHNKATTQVAIPLKL